MVKTYTATVNTNVGYPFRNLIWNYTKKHYNSLTFFSIIKLLDINPGNTTKSALSFLLFLIALKNIKGVKGNLNI